MIMKKQQIKYTAKEIVSIAIIWLFALSLVYIIWLKIELLLHK